MLRRIFVPGRREINGSWRKLHNEEFHNLYSSSIIRIRVVRQRRRACSMNVEKRSYWWESQKEGQAVAWFTILR
jgi:hypothetical protein